MLSCHFFTEKTSYHTVGPQLFADFVFSTCLALLADHNACPQLFADVVFQYPAKKHPMHQPMYDILAGPPLLPTSFVRPLDRNVSPQLFADFVFIHLDKHIIHTWNEIAD